MLRVATHLRARLAANASKVRRGNSPGYPGAVSGAPVAAYPRMAGSARRSEACSIRLALPVSTVGALCAGCADLLSLFVALADQLGFIICALPAKVKPIYQVFRINKESFPLKGEPPQGTAAVRLLICESLQKTDSCYDNLQVNRSLRVKGW